MDIAQDTEFINVERQRFISDFARQDSNITYLRRLSRAEVQDMVPNQDGLNFMDKKKTGSEFWIEYHLFMKDGEVPIIAQWRATDGGVARTKRGTKPTCRADRRYKYKAEGMVTKIDTTANA
jgi:hypothetical protein